MLGHFFVYSHKQYWLTPTYFREDFYFEHIFPHLKSLKIKSSKIDSWKQLLTKYLIKIASISYVTYGKDLIKNIFCRLF